MDSFRELASDLEPAFGSHVPEMVEPASHPGEERRMQVRAYNYWTSLLSGRDFPSVEDLEPASIADFARNSVLLDFTAGPADPTAAYIGATLRRECDLDPDCDSIAEVPAGSLLSRLTDYYPQILDSRSPVGFEAEFRNQRGQSSVYRGILMPFSSDGDTIDFVYGVFNWTEVEAAAEPEIQAEATDAPETAVSIEPESAPEPEPAAEHLAWQNGPMSDPDVLQSADEASLADWLSAARATAEDAKAADGRSRQALYRALAQAYDFSCAATEQPDDYAALLDECGITIQARAPMTAVAKLVFGADYDKARLTEYAAALSYAARQGIATGEFQVFIEGAEGGLKGLVEAERRLRRPDGHPGEGWREQLCARIRQLEARPLDMLAGNGEFALVLVRRDETGAVSPIAAVSDPALLDKALKKAAA